MFYAISFVFKFLLNTSRRLIEEFEQKSSNNTTRIPLVFQGINFQKGVCWWLVRIQKQKRAFCSSERKKCQQELQQSTES